MAIKECVECGAELKLRSAPCPLCGTDPEAEPKRATWAAPPKKPQPVTNVDDYQSDLRKLRDELKRLREAEAS
ncbi:MAG: hypothetical protein M3174_02220 [Actinomycetota bacterium]|nr:hypothetical protein [Actinomycetota bacterium]